MRDVRLFNGLLWSLNALLAAAIVVFAWKYLLSSQQAQLLRDFNPEEGPGGPVVGPTQTNDSILKTLRNPVKKDSIGIGGPPVVQYFKAVLKGTIPTTDPKRGCAFIKSSAKNVELLALMGEDILHEGKTYEEFRGWKLVEVSKDRATFSNGTLKQELVLDQTITPVPGAGGPVGIGAAGVSRAGQPYEGGAYQSRLLAQSEGRHVWGMDAAEIDWAAQNAESILDNDFSLSLHPNGGVKIDNVRGGSIGAARGMQPGDVLKNVNGQPLQSVADMKTLMGNPQMRRTTGLTLTVERNGKPVVIEYRPLPGAPVQPGQPAPVPQR